MASVLLAFSLPTFNHNSMHIFYSSESPAILVTQKWKIIAASVEATAHVIPWQQVYWNSCRLLLFLEELKCKT